MVKIKRILTGLIFLLILVQTSFAAGAPEKGAGPVNSKTYNHEKFDSLVISGIAEYEIQMANAYDVLVTADDSILRLVEMEQRGNTLSVVFPEAYKYEPGTLKAVIQVPRLRTLRVDGKSHGTFLGVPIPGDMNINITDGSSLEAEHLAADKVLVEVSVDSLFFGHIEVQELSLRVYSSFVNLTGTAGLLRCFSDTGDVVLSEMYNNTAFLEFKNESTGICSLKDADGIKPYAATTVKLSGESELTLSTEGEIYEDIEEDSNLYQLDS